MNNAMRVILSPPKVLLNPPLYIGEVVLVVAVIVITKTSLLREALCVAIRTKRLQVLQLKPRLSLLKLLAF
jgi:hypothetical protein